MKTTLSDWQAVEQYADNTDLKFTASYLDLVNSGRFPADAFTLGQLASKGWLLTELRKVTPHSHPANLAILGCWIGTLVQQLKGQVLSMPEWGSEHVTSRIYGFDQDPAIVELSEQFNHRLVQAGWQYKGVVADVSMLDCNNMVFETGGELIEVKPDVVINTSCEHMDSDWFYTCDTDQLIVMQTNDSPDYEGHINTCESIADMQAKYPLSNSLYCGALETPAYTRFMQIGYR